MKLNFFILFSSAATGLFNDATALDNGRTVQLGNAIDYAIVPSSHKPASHPYHQSSASSSGLALFKDPIRHNGVSTPIELRRGLGIRGLVPSAYIPLELDVERCMEQIAAKKGRPIDQYSYLQSIQDVSERLYFAILTKHTATVMPIVYTPIVGEGTYRRYNTVCYSLADPFVHSFVQLTTASCLDSPIPIPILVCS
jgi:hypothetical protein